MCSRQRRSENRIADVQPQQSLDLHRLAVQQPLVYGMPVQHRQRKISISQAKYPSTCGTNVFPRIRHDRHLHELVWWDVKKMPGGLANGSYTADWSSNV